VLEYIKDLLKSELDEIDKSEIKMLVKDYMIDDDIEEQYNDDRCEELITELLAKMKKAI